jgi:hypothetical protein
LVQFTEIFFIVVYDDGIIIRVQVYAVDTLTITKSPFESGHGHGCSDAGISDFSDRYINQPGKGPSFHTEEFMRGYDTGYNACSNAMK